MKPSPRNKRYTRQRTPEEIEADDLKRKQLLEAWTKEFEAEQRQRERAENILNTLGIPHTGQTVDAAELADILMDEEKVKVILTKVRNKAFW